MKNWQSILKIFGSVSVIIGVIVGSITIASALDIPVRWWPWMSEHQSVVVLASETRLLVDSMEKKDIKDNLYRARRDADEFRAEGKRVPGYIRQRILDLEQDLEEINVKIDRDRRMIERKKVED